MSHRRWSIISNTFNPQQQPTSGSIQSIADLNPALHRNIFFLFILLLRSFSFTYYVT